MKTKKSILFLALGLGFGAANGAFAQFLDFSHPARATAMGGNLVAIPRGSAALNFNPAGLSLQDRFEVSARYESLFTGFDGDSLSISNLSALAPLGNLGGTGFSWDHLGADLLAQDRLRAGWGKHLQVGGVMRDFAAGFSLSFLTERYTLSAPLQGVSVSDLSPSAFALGAGFLMSVEPGLTVGFSAEDINRPNLGVVGVDRQPLFLRWGLAAELFAGTPVQWILTASQSFSRSNLETQGGVECFLAKYGARLRGGLSPYQGAVGLGYIWSNFSIDYAYSFSAFRSTRLSGATFPGSHQVEIGFKWGTGRMETTYMEFYRKAQENEARGDWEKANLYYLECISLKNGSAAEEGHRRVLVEYNRQRAAQYYNEGQEAQQRGMIFDAQNDYEMAARLSPDNAQYTEALSQAALEAARASIDNEVAEAIRQISALIARGDSKGALRSVSQALQRHPHNPALELIQASLGQEEVSEAKAPPAVKAAKEAAKLVTAEADLYLAHGQVDMARDNLEKALKANPNNTQIKIKLIRLAAPTPVVSPGNARLAQDLYEKGLRNYLDGNLAEAIKNWDKSLKSDPTNRRVQNNLIRAKIEEKMEHP